MSDGIVSGASAQEFFGELVVESLDHRHAKVRRETEFYLVSLLSDRLQRRAPVGDTGEEDQEPLAFILKRALEGSREERRRQLRRLGDTSLFVSGFFGDSLAGSLIDVDYYIAMGERAYDTLREEPRAPAGAKELFGELSERFEEFVDLFAEVAEQCDLGSNRGLVRLYERFLLTGSQRVARRLQERGVALFSGPGRPRGLKH